MGAILESWWRWCQGRRWNLRAWPRSRAGLGSSPLTAAATAPTITRSTAPTTTIPFSIIRHSTRPASAALRHQFCLLTRSRNSICNRSLAPSTGATAVRWSTSSPSRGRIIFTVRRSSFCATTPWTRETFLIATRIRRALSATTSLARRWAARSSKTRLSSLARTKGNVSA